MEGSAIYRVLVSDNGLLVSFTERFADGRSRDVFTMGEAREIAQQVRREGVTGVKVLGIMEDADCESSA